LRGPKRSCRRPPASAPRPRKKIAVANVQVVVVFDHPKLAIRGWVKRLHE
jgi:hypothetical protein